MLINPTYGAGGGSPTPSSGYVEEGLICLYDGDTQEAVFTTSPRAMDKTIYLQQCNSSDGATIEGYILMSGNSINSFSRGFNAGTGGTEFCLGFGNGGSSSGSDYHFNPMAYWGANLDYEIYPAGLYYGDKHTFAIVSTPDPELQTDNVLTFYVDGIQVGEPNYFRQYRESMLDFGGVVVEGGTSRPMNGTLHSGRFYNRALTAAELAANHANDVARYGGNN